jgi:hypothetical protein
VVGCIAEGRVLGFRGGVGYINSVV